MSDVKVSNLMINIATWAYGIGYAKLKCIIMLVAASKVAVESMWTLKTARTD